MVDIRRTKLSHTLKKLQPVTTYATLIEGMIQKKIDEARAQADEEDQQGETHAKGES